MSKPTKPDPWGATASPAHRVVPPTEYRRDIGHCQVLVVDYTAKNVGWYVCVETGDIEGARWAQYSVETREQAEALAEKAAPLLAALAETMEEDTNG